MYCVYGNSSWYTNGGPLFGGGPLLGGFVKGGSTVVIKFLHELMHIDEHFYHLWKWKKYETTMNAMLNQSLIKYTVLSKLITTLLSLYECTVYS